MSFRNYMSVFNDIEDDFTEFVKELAFEIGVQLSEDMPVDSGKARSSTQIDNAPNDWWREPYFDYGKNSGRDKSETFNLMSVTLDLRKEAKAIRPFENVYIMNNASDDEGRPYSGLLADGYSIQTSKGMVDRVIYFSIRETELKMSHKFTLLYDLSYSL